MADSTLLTRREGHVEYLTLNRPDVRNAFNDTMIAELTAWAAAVRADAAVRVVVIGGAGKSFSAGADVTWMARAAAYTHDQNVADATAASAMFGAIDTLPVPVVGRIQGAALGGGSGLAAVCDIVVTETEALFGFTEARLGLIPAVISPFVIAKIGRSAARELFLTASRFSAARALEIGLVHRVVQADALDDTVQAVVHELLASGPEATAAAKALIAAVVDTPASEQQALTAHAIATRRVSAEGQEGLAAFLGKRPAAWTPR